MDFQCNVCGTWAKEIPVELIDREISSCPHCLSSVRFRSIVHLVSLALFGRSIALPDFPSNQAIIGIGLSDWDGYAKPLAEKIGYTNTYYHQEPFFDICKPVTVRAQSCDFLISSEVFEHVAPPAQIAFQHAFDVLKPGGTLILTVPFTNEDRTREHFPELHDYTIAKLSDDYVLLNRKVDGELVHHENLVFHGGPGSTLEMRVYSREALKRHLADAGFVDVQFLDEDAPQWGILHKNPWSLPILARRPGPVALFAAETPTDVPPADAPTPAVFEPAPAVAVVGPAPVAISRAKSAFRDIPTLLLLAFVALGLFGLFRSKILVEQLWQPQFLKQSIYLFVAVGCLAAAMCVAAIRYGRRPETALALLLVSIAATLGGPAATGIVLFFALSSWCLGALVLQPFKTDQTPSNVLVGVVVGWAIYAMLFTMVASIPVNMAATHTIVLALPIVVAAIIRSLRNQFYQLVVQALQFRTSAKRADVAGNLGLILCVIILSLHIALVALPDRFFDALVMHLYIPSFMSAHRAWSFDAYNHAFAFMPTAADMLYAHMFILQGETAARLLNCLAFVLTGVATFQIISRICSRTVSIWSIALLVSIPLTFIETATLFVENTLTMFLTTAIAALIGTKFRVELRDYLAILLLIAGATMVKLHGAIAAIVIGSICLALYLRNKRPAQSFLPVTMITLLVGTAALWPYFYAWLKTGNPVFPYYNHIFKSAFFPAIDFLDRRWMGNFSISFPYDATFGTSKFVEAYDGALGFTLFTLLAAGMAAALIRRDKIAILCGGLGLFFVISFAAKIQYVRYLMIFVPLLMVPVAMAIQHVRQVRYMRIPVACVVLGIIALNMYKMPAGAAVLGVSDLAACCNEAARHKLETSQVPERVINRIVNEQYGPTAQVLYLGNPFGALLQGTAIYTVWYNSQYSSDFASVKDEADLVALLKRVAPTHVVVDTASSRPLDKIAEAHLQKTGRLIVRVGATALYALAAGS